METMEKAQFALEVLQDVMRELETAIPTRGRGPFGNYCSLEFVHGQDGSEVLRIVTHGNFATYISTLDDAEAGKPKTQLVEETVQYIKRREKEKGDEIAERKKVAAYWKEVATRVNVGVEALVRSAIQDEAMIEKICPRVKRAVMRAFPQQCWVSDPDEDDIPF